MNWLQRIAQADEYPFSRLEDQGRKFETGVPVEFRFLHNKEKAPNFGPRYQQDIEPAGRYMIHNEEPGDLTNTSWQTDLAQFSNPLVIEFNVDDDSSYNEHSWKSFLSKKFGGLKGKQLSKAIAKAGYDGIVTIKKYEGKPFGTGEIVDLRMFHNDGAKPMALPQPVPDSERRPHGEFPGGVKRIDDIMTEETAQSERDSYPNMGDGRPGSFGVFYPINDTEGIKYTKDELEASNVEKAYYQKFDWVVPILSPPRPVQVGDRALWGIHMKMIQPLENWREQGLVSSLWDSFNKGDFLSIEKVMEDNMGDEHPDAMSVDLILNIYNRMKYILTENEKHLGLTDIHGGNVGWDGDRLKVFDLGPDVSGGGLLNNVNQGLANWQSL